MTENKTPENADLMLLMALGYFEQKVDDLLIVLGGHPTTTEQKDSARHALTYLGIAGLSKDEISEATRALCARYSLPPEINLYDLIVDLTIMSPDEDPPPTDPTILII